jgi:hypothetical protein
MNFPYAFVTPVLAHATQRKLLKSCVIQAAGNCIEKSMPITVKPHLSNFSSFTEEKAISFKTFSQITVQ